MKRYQSVVVVGLISFCLILLLVFRGPAEPVTVTALGRTNLVSQTPCWAFELHNVSRTDFNYFYEVEAATEGGWQTAKTQPQEARRACYLPARSSRVFVFPENSEGKAWRIAFNYQLVGSPFLSKINSLTTKLGIRSVFEFKRLVSPEVKNKDVTHALE